MSKDLRSEIFIIYLLKHSRYTYLNAFAGEAHLSFGIFHYLRINVLCGGSVENKSVFICSVKEHSSYSGLVSIGGCKVECGIFIYQPEHFLWGHNYQFLSFF